MTKLLLIIGLLLLAATMAKGQEWFPLDQGLAASAVSEVRKIIVGPDQQIYVGGVFFHSGRGDTVRGISRWDRSEEIWTSEYSSGSAYVWDFGFFEDDMYACAKMTPESSITDEVFHYWMDSSWILDPSGPHDMVFNSRVIGGELYILGGFEQVGENPSYGIAIYDGETFAPFFGSYSGEFHRLEDVAEFQSELYVTGQNMTGAPLYEWRGLAKLGEDELEVAHEDFTGNFFQMWPHCLEVYDGELYIGGWFHEGQGFAGSGIVRFDGEEMHDVGGGVNLPVSDMKVYNGELYVVGAFGRIGEESIWENLSAGEHCSGVAKWDGELWTCLLQENTDAGRIRTLEIYNDTLYVGGAFPDLLGDTLMSMIAALPLDTSTGFLEDVAQLAGLTLYPNPSQGEISLDFGQLLSQEAEIEIFNTGLLDSPDGIFPAAHHHICIF